ncbi:MAG: primosomal protein N' [Anaerolineaceae bacterium]|jgi:primosomal protein N' (replication factor Y)|nr:primosomal protein N' [Anaerolineaceae bacterium]
MSAFAEVSINLSQIERTYHYSIPPDLQGQIQPGSLVVVPFGKQIVQGVVLALPEQAEVPDLKPIIELLAPDTLLIEQQISLAQWLSQHHFTPLGACMQLMIPTGLSRRADISVDLAADLPSDLSPFSQTQQRLLKLLKSRGELRGNQIDRAIPKVDWRKGLDWLRSQGLVHTNNILPPPRVAAKTLRTAALSIQPSGVASLKKETLGKTPITQTRRGKVLGLLARQAFPLDFSWIYAETDANYADLSYLADAGLIHFNETEVWRDPLAEIEVTLEEAPELTSDQSQVWQKVQAEWKQPKPRPVLLHGVTGSGKTEIYMRAVQSVLDAGKQCLVLVPEISMTPQTVRRFMARFPNQVGLYHSKLSEGERYDTWRRARQGDLQIIIGSRSALFVPLPKLGLIVVDECDNSSYDESERMPFYQAVPTAEALANISQANLLLGSATPAVEQYFKAQRGDWRLLEMPRRILAHRQTLANQALSLKFDLPKFATADDLLTFDLPKVQIVDMRKELTSGNSSVLSRSLESRLEKVLSKNQQAILFLNRRGQATYVFCRHCGQSLRCPNDDQPLTWHGSQQGLLCHLCGYSRKMPTKCPNCGSTQIRQLGLGTAKLEEIVKNRFPEARLLRWDADTTKNKDDHELILSHFSAHRADILIGTQMLAKGLDLPLVTLVGIVLAEVGLNLPDYRAAERSFQVLTQVSGRAGRSPLGGEVVLQTYQPENYVIQAASRHDFGGFYEQELEYRRMLGYPPFNRIIRLEYRHLSQSKAEQEARQLAAIISDQIDSKGLHQTDMIGLLPPYYARMHGLWRWQIILRGPNPEALLPDLPLRDWQIEVDPPSLL